MLATGLRVLQIALAGACVLLLYGTITPLLGAVSPAEASLPPLELPEEKTLDWKSLAVIEQRNLFKTPENAPPPAPVSEEIAESKLRVKLLGTAAVEVGDGRKDNPSVATFEDDRGETVTVRIKGLIAGATVLSIEPKRVVVDNRGKREQISLHDEDGPQVKRSGRNSRPKSNARRRTTNRRVNAARANPRTGRGLERLASRARPNPPAPPAADDREAIGSQLLQPFFPDAGIREGETLVSINGVAIKGRPQTEILEMLGEPSPKTLVLGTADGSTRPVEVDQR